MSNNTWIERFRREIGLKNAIILHGNVLDLCYNNIDNTYTSLTSVISAQLKAKKFSSIVKWDRVSGIDYDVSDADLISKVRETQANANTPSGSTGEVYELDDDFFETGATDNSPKMNCIDEFFPFLLDALKNSQGGKAYIIDYSDFIFGTSNTLSEKEREWLAILSKAINEIASYDIMHSNFTKRSDIVIFITSKTASIPAAFYLNNPSISRINIPLPSRLERRDFVNQNYNCIYLENDLRSSGAYDDFIDSLEGLTLKDIAQIMKLSYLSKEEAGDMSAEKLINLYKYGEKNSPWESLSKDKLRDIEARLGARVKGQESAIEKVKDVIIRAYTGFSGLQHSSKQRKPKGTLFFVGPTGVGKTELAKSLAEFLFGDENACIRFDMSEFNHEHSDQRLVGAPPGYVGYEEGGQLTNAVKERPFCVLLFDEIEKAHGRILDKFLQILEDGRLTDGKGETVSFSETIIIFTSNIGSSKIDYVNDENPTDVQRKYVEEVKRHFITELQRPELLNRIGDNNIVAFNYIQDVSVLTQILKIKFKQIQSFINERYEVGIEFENEEKALLAIANSTNRGNGGRGVLNSLETYVVNPLSGFIFDNEEYLGPGRKIVISSLSETRPFFDFELGI